MSSVSATLWGAIAALAGLILFSCGVYFMRFNAMCSADESHIQCIRSWLSAIGPIMAMIALIVGIWQFSVNRDSAERQNRAYVGVSGGGMQIVNLSPGQGQAIAVEIKLSNTGKTPAYDFRTWYPNVVVGSAESPPFTDPPSPALSQQSSVLFAGNDVTMVSIVALTQDEIGEVRDGKKSIFAWGAASYDDAFGRKRTLRFHDKNGHERVGAPLTWPLSPVAPGYQSD